MPELPEVETIKNELLPYVIGRTIESIDIYWDAMVKYPPAGEFRAQVAGQQIVGLARRGKYLFFHLSGGDVLVMHMKMTGSLLVNPSDNRFTRAVLHLDKGIDVHFWDPRKFGKMWLEKDCDAVIKELGPEPLDADFTPQVLAGILRGRKAPVKAVILDQSRIAGIGNMYADEALFLAKIHPEKPAGELTQAEIKRLHSAVKAVLLKALNLKGASIRNYIRPDGTPGTAHDEFNVAHGTGKNCPVCRTPIQRLVVRGRGTYICPRCQPAP
ncbi:MAG: bifunctional DNA-formamidopyrimidine glycosylase/DNA-(apurinic or apyrimidinic site) lyase [Dehalococcoidales bacterium]|nr:bifunctional DNA-formamidopyrimidine glycosylase/DNA-(apurinic or apyrimidinic site) lyase [Dehalococcoidales bacterium]